jgi:surface protein
MLAMFSGCWNSGFTSLDLSSFNTTNVTTMGSMFKQCTSLVTIYASNLWSTEKVTSSNEMFLYCTKLKGGRAYTSSKTDKTYAKTSGGYLTYKAAPVAA